MSEPTQYDLVQDTRIQGVEDLVQTTYTPFQGPEFSYPVVHQPMDDEMWQQVTLGVGSGVLDVGGQPYWLRDLSDVTDTGKLTVSKTAGTAQAILRGFYHRLNQDTTLSFPPVSRKTVYQTVLEYDPLRHKEPGGPIRVRVLTSLDWSGGKHYLPLWDLERDPSQLLSQAKVTQRRPKIAPTIIVDREENLPAVQGQLWGTRAIAWKTREEFIAQGSNEAGHPDQWVSMTSPALTPLNLDSNRKKAPHGAVPSVQRVGEVLHLYGRVAMTSDGNFSPRDVGWGLGYIPRSVIESRTLEEQHFATFSQSGQPPRIDGISVEPNGYLTVFPSTSTNWVSLDGIRILLGRP